MKKNCIFNYFIAFVVATFIGFSSPFVFASEASCNYETIIENIADKYIGKSVPGACVIISEHGEIVFSKAYGYADLEKTIPMDLENTVFEWGSISKTFIWVSVMQLCEEGKINLNADIRNYLPKKFLKNLHFDEPISMLHLMNHTAGFEEQLIDLRYFAKDEELKLAEVLSSHQPKQIFSPGEICAYSNWGSTLAAFIVERMSNQNYKKYVTENILKPLQMNDTSIGPFHNNNPKLMKRKATGYSFSKKRFKKEPNMYLRMYPAGGMNGSAKDLLKYVQELAKNYKKDSLLFLNSKTKAELFTETYRSYGANSGLSHGFWQYADNSKILGHEGGTYGFKTQIWVEPKNERAILILTNVMETKFCSEIMEKIVYIETSKSKTKKDSDLNMFNGDYLPARSAFTSIGKLQGQMQMISIKATDNNQLCLTMPFGDKKKYYEQIDSNIFFCKDSNPEEKILGFKITDDKVISMSFRLAHDYFPAPKTQGKLEFLLGFVTYISTTILFLTLMIINMISVLLNRNIYTCPRLCIYICGTILGTSGILGIIHWFSIYGIVSHEIIFISTTGWCVCVVGGLCGVYTYFKEKNLKNAGLLLVFIAQAFSAYYLGFLTFI